MTQQLHFRGHLQKNWKRALERSVNPRSQQHNSQQPGGGIGPSASATINWIHKMWYMHTADSIQPQKENPGACSMVNLEDTYVKWNEPVTEGHIPHGATHMRCLEHWESRALGSQGRGAGNETLRFHEASELDGGDGYTTWMYFMPSYTFKMAKWKTSRYVPQNF